MFLPLEAVCRDPPSDQCCRKELQQCRERSTLGAQEIKNSLRNSRLALSYFEACCLLVQLTTAGGGSVWGWGLKLEWPQYEATGLRQCASRTSRESFSRTDPKDKPIKANHP